MGFISIRDHLLKLVERLKKIFKMATIENICDWVSLKDTQICLIVQEQRGQFGYFFLYPWRSSSWLSVWCSHWATDLETRGILATTSSSTSGISLCSPAWYQSERFSQKCMLQEQCVRGFYLNVWVALNLPDLLDMNDKSYSLCAFINLNNGNRESHIGMTRQKRYLT